METDNGLVKARFTTGKHGTKQDYLAVHGTEWVLVAEGFLPRSCEKVKVEVFTDFEDEQRVDAKALSHFSFPATPKRSPGANSDSP